jgi:peptide/nickel transport system substrate-binding protein/oligopeptide transport system substrate-binding protein
MKNTLIASSGLLAAALVAMLALSGCAGLQPGAPAAAPADQTAQAEKPAAPAAATAPATPAPDKAAQPEAADNAEQPRELVFATLAGSLSFDPARAYTSLEAQVYTAIYEGLVTYNPLTLEPVPGAARRWDVSDDGRFYRFYLREEGRFSNGDPVTAKVFYDSWFRVLDPATGAEYSTFFDVIKGARAFRTGQHAAADQVGIRVVGNYVLEVELEEPAPHFLRVLCHMAFVPIHPFYQRDQEWQKRSSIVGNGPFFVYEKSDSEIVFARNNLYWGRSEVKLDRIVMRLLASPGAASEGFNQGLIHWATSWDSSVLDDTSSVVFNPLFATSFYFFRSDSEPWTRPDVRRALALLIPWEAVRTEQIFFPTASLVYKIPGYPDVQRIEKTDRDEALRLLAAAGFPQGRGLPKLVFRVGAGGESERVAKLIGDAWKEAVGLEVEISTIDYEQYFASIKGDGYTIGQMTWIGDFLDPLTFLQMWTSDSNLNDARYSNSEYDRLVSEGSALTGEERYAKFGEAESIILSTGVILPINHQPSLNLIDLDKIDGWFPNPLDIHPFRYLEFKGPQMLPNVVMR